MYREQIDWKERAGTVAIVIGLHVAVAAVAMTAKTVVQGPAERENIEIFDVAIEPPPPIIEDIPEVEQTAPREEGAASDKNIESDATPVVAPDPVVVTPTPNPIVASPTPNEGNDATQGASDEEGEGTGAGGSGDGTGAGSGGDGKGGGGGTRPSVIQSTTLTQKDFPKEIRKAWPSNGAVYVAIRVQTNGTATDCKVNRGINPNIDAWVCRLVEQKVRFNPARDAQGRPYVAWYGYVQYAIF